VLSKEEVHMSGRFTRILVPTDFGAASDAALACGRDLAIRFDARLYLLHVVEDPLAAGTWTPEVYVGASAQLHETLLRDAQERLAQALTAEERERFKVVTEVRVGGAADTIGEFARANAIDLIVMGTHGRRGLAHMFLGSVAERVVRTAPCPVLTIREDRTGLAVEGAVQAREARV
jgi:nucleotide-binding universal stress UspA family protein